MEFFLNYICLPIVVLAIVVFVHEMGHFAMARYFGISTPVFSVGFGREIFGYTDKRGTRWKLSAFPLGGYVSIDGRDTDPLYQRAWIAAAGPLANFIFAIFVMFWIPIFMGAPKTPPLVVALSTTGGAYAAGVQPGDRVIRLGGHDLPYYSEEIGSYVQNAEGNLIDATIIRNGQRHELSIVVRETEETDDFGEADRPKRMGIIFAGHNFKLSAINEVNGINTEGNIALARAELIKNFGKKITINFGKGTDRDSLYTFIDPTLNKDLQIEGSPKFSSLILWDNRDVEYMPVGVGEGLLSALDLTYQVCKKTLGVIYQIISGKKDTGDLGGVVAISSMTGEVAEQAKTVGLYYLFRFVAILSVNIGFINLLPLPLLDGGHLMFYGIEAIRGRPPSLKVKAYVYAAGIMFIILLSLTVTIRDILEKMAE